MTCCICSRSMEFFAKSKIIKKYSISYFTCSHCKFIQTEEPYWLKEAYNDSINISDTGILYRNILLSKKTALALYAFFNSKSNFLDYAGGYGIFTRLMRDFGFNFFWHDPYTKNLFARGFEYIPDSSNQPIEVLTAFECFEHFADPVSELKKMLKISTNIIFTTTLLPKPVPIPGKWWYYGLEHGQHISFYSLQSLQLLADTFKLNFYSNGKDFHLFTTHKINPALFKTILIFNKLGAQYIVKRLMPGRTHGDMLQIISRMGDNG